MARRYIDPALKIEAVRLRVEERLGIQAIMARTGIAKGTLSLLLRDHPLKATELHERSSASAAALNSDRWAGHVAGQKYGKPGPGSNAPRHSVVVRYVAVNSDGCVRFPMKLVYSLGNNIPLTRAEVREFYPYIHSDAMHIVGLVIHRIDGEDVAVLGMTQCFVHQVTAAAYIDGERRKYSDWFLNELATVCNVDPVSNAIGKLSFSAFLREFDDFLDAWHEPAGDRTFRSATNTALGRLAAQLAADPESGVPWPVHPRTYTY